MDRRIDQLTAGFALTLTSIIEVNENPGGTNFHRKYTIQQLIDFIAPLLGVATFDTTAEMRASTSFSNGQFALRYGDLTVSDGNTVPYRYSTDPSTAGMVDDGESIIKPTIILLADPGRYLQVII